MLRDVYTDDTGDDSVYPELSCPKCGEYHPDLLVWDIDAEKVTCQSCGTVYATGDDHVS